MTRSFSRGLRLSASLSMLVGAVVLGARSGAAEPDAFAPLSQEYDGQVRPLLKRFCLECHSTETQEGELDLERFGKLDDVRRSIKTWLKVVEMLDNGEMPPKDSEQLSADERKQLRGWIDRYLKAEAHASAGDPGPVVLRRLSNAQYTYTVRDLTLVELDPLREFPLDNAAGEGFTNTGNAAVMSPSLLTKYFDAGKEIAQHAVPLPGGFRFSNSTTPRDWTDEILTQIRQLYLEFSNPEQVSKALVQGHIFESKDAGRIPVQQYLAATLAEREALASGAKSIAAVAAERHLNAKYLGTLWGMLNGAEGSQLLDKLRAGWRSATPGQEAALAGEIAAWQGALTKFQTVGHMKSWMAAQSPLTARHEVRLKLSPAEGAKEVKVYLATGEAGDGTTGDYVVWQNPRLVAPGRPDLPLRDVRSVTRELNKHREQILASTAKALGAVDEASRKTDPIDVAETAARHGVNADALVAWLDFFGVSSTSKPQLNHFKQRIDSTGGYSFVKGWGSNDTPSIVSNATDKHVRIPGNLKAHGVVVHPSPTLAAVAGWQSPIAGPVRVEAKVQHAHPECGNGVTWSLELRRGNTRQVLASGTSAGASVVTAGPVEPGVVRPGDLVSLVIGPRDANHACDLTDIELMVTALGGEAREWNLNRDISIDISAANPHADHFGNADVWHFYTEPATGAGAAPTIPAGSLLAKWQAAEKPEDRQPLADQVQQLLQTGPPADAKNPDAVLYQQLTSLGGRLLSGIRARFAATPAGDKSADPAADWGPDPTQFGHHPDGTAIDPASLCVQASSVIEIRLPADLVTDAELVTTAVLEPRTGVEGSVQPIASLARPEGLAALRPGEPVLVSDGGQARGRYERAFEDFRQLFPAALCYIRIVPVDEAVTLTLYHREDEPLCRLMLDDEQHARLDRLWDELHFISHDALTLVDAFEQLMQYATQDSDPRLFEPYRKPIYDQAEQFRRALVDAEPRQVDALVAFAAKAYRRPLSEAQAVELRNLYARLREQELPHDEAFRYTLARVFVSPEFLYRIEEPGPKAEPAPISDIELASRLSYFLWSSSPDEQLSAAAVAGELHSPDRLAAEARRMLGDGRVRRLADEFACQWLHIYDFKSLDEKSERHFPTFVALRGDMHEEAVQFFTDLFQHDRSVLSIYNADHVFVNEALATHYEIPGIKGAEWRRVDGAGKYGRGGILALASTLAHESGASRTSPILRGNWVSEVLLGEKLPKPPKDVPVLPDDEAATEGLTVRQLVEKHSSDSRCSGCHAKMDPLGFSLEGFDAIGRRREKDLAGRPIDTRAKLLDGREFQDISGLRDYLLGQRRDAVVRQFNKKLLGYALGRGVQLSDEPLLEEMRAQLEKKDYRFSVAVETIVRSRQFREIRGRDAQVSDAP